MVLTVIDRFSKFAHFIPLAKLPSAKETAEVPVREVFHIHGLPTVIISDRGTQFTSAVWRSFCRALGASVSLTSSFHLQSNGQAEQANQVMETSLRCLTSSNPTTWASQLPWIEYAAIISHRFVIVSIDAHLWIPTSALPSQEKEISVPSVQFHIRRCHCACSALLRSLPRTGQSPTHHCL